MTITTRSGLYRGSRDERIKLNRNIPRPEPQNLRFRPRRNESHSTTQSILTDIYRELAVTSASAHCCRLPVEADGRQSTYCEPIAALRLKS